MNRPLFFVAQQIGLCSHLSKALLWLPMAVLLAAAPVFALDDAPIKPRASDPIVGKEKSKLCQGCHGEDGNSTGEMIPKLAGQYEKYILKQLQDYRAGIRSHEIMNAMAVNLKDQDMADISSYFANQMKMKGKGSTATEQGKNLYLKGDISHGVMSCIYCHGASGKGLTPDTAMYPMIGGQHKAYLLRQLIDFKENNRTNSQNAIMNRIVSPLKDEDLEALAEYLSEQ